MLFTKNNIFKIVENNPTVEIEVIARQLVRNFSSSTEFEAKPLNDNTWTQLHIEVPKSKKYIFKQIKEYSLTETSTGFKIYINKEVTPIDVRILTGRIIEYSKKPKLTYVYTLRQKISLTLFKLAKYLYPARRHDKNI